MESILVPTDRAGIAYLAACQVRRARGSELEFIADQIGILSAEPGTNVQRDGSRLWIDVPLANEVAGRSAKHAARRSTGHAAKP